MEIGLKRQAGFAAIFELIVLALVISALGVVGYRAMHKSATAGSTLASQHATAPQAYSGQSANSGLPLVSTLSTTHPSTTTPANKSRSHPAPSPSPAPPPSVPVSGSVTGYVYNTTRCGNLPAGGTCNAQPQPYQATVEVQTPNGSPVTSFTSAADGSFGVNLAPGSYVLVPQTYNGGATTAADQSITVTSGQSTTIKIYYSTNTA